MEFFNHAGKKAIGSRVRLLAEKITSEASQIYKLYNIDMAPKWFPVFFVLSNNEAKTVTDIAREIGHSHPSVSKIVNEMAKAGYLIDKQETKDGRRNVVKLSPKGKLITERIQDQYTDVEKAVEEISVHTTHDLWKAIGEWEYLLEQKSLLRRVAELRKKREGSQFEIVSYNRKYKDDFRKLNEAWIRKYFKIEKADRLALENPKPYILDKGGHILIALHEGIAVGTCALIKLKDRNGFELAKMAVSPSVQGKGLGYLLGLAAIEKARSLKAEVLYLESNTLLKPALSLYHKLGFKKVTGYPTPYERSNIQMELVL